MHELIALIIVALPVLNRVDILCKKFPDFNLRKLQKQILAMANHLSLWL